MQHVKSSGSLATTTTFCLIAALSTDSCLCTSCLYHNNKEYKNHLLASIVGPIVSIMCNRFSGRSLVFVGACLLSIALMISGFAPNQLFLYFSYGIIGGKSVIQYGVRMFVV